MTIQSEPKSLYAAPGNAADENINIRDQPAPEQDQYGYKIREQPMGTKRKIKVILMGAGASSLNFFKKAEEEMQNLDIVCYEKNKDIGGTWLENRYPGTSFTCGTLAHTTCIISPRCHLDANCLVLLYLP